MKITVIGSGYVGLVTACCFAEIGNDVICVDHDQRKIDALRQGKPTVYEEFLPELLTRHGGARLNFSWDLVESVRSADIIFVAVGTPQSADGQADLSYVEAVAHQIAPALGNGFKLIVNKSTVPVYTAERVRRTLLLSGAKPETFDVASNPEFFREGTAVTGFLYPDRIVIGADADRSVALLREVYQPLTTGAYRETATAIPPPQNALAKIRLIATTTKSAELIKHSANAFLAMKVSFINAVSNVCDAVGADVEEVCEGMGSDARIGKRFLKPGIGYGGSCFPKDIIAYRAVAIENGYHFNLLTEIMRTNEEQRLRFIAKIRRTLWNLKGKRLGVLGLAFKGGTDDIRESPAIYIIQALLREGCIISVFDPAAMKNARECDFGSQLKFAEGAYEAAQGCDALLILTDWEEFACLDLVRLRGELKHPIIFDGRNLYSPEEVAKAGITYVSVGRPDVSPEGLPVASL